MTTYINKWEISAMRWKLFKLVKCKCQMKNTVSKTKNYFDILMSRMDTGEERISGIKDRWEIRQTKTQREKKGKNEKHTSKNPGTISNGLTYMSLESPKKIETIG